MKLILYFLNCLTIFGMHFLSPNKISKQLRIKYNGEEAFQIFSKDMLPNQYYKIMVHYLGSVTYFKADRYRAIVGSICLTDSVRVSTGVSVTTDLTSVVCLVK